jgi:hypothetical protein
MAKTTDLASQEALQIQQDSLYSLRGAIELVVAEA